MAQKEREVAGEDGWFFNIEFVETLEKGGCTMYAASLRAFVVVRIIDPARRQLSLKKCWYD